MEIKCFTYTIILIAATIAATGCISLSDAAPPSQRESQLEPKTTRQGDMPNYELMESIPKLSDALEVARSPYEPVTPKQNDDLPFTSTSLEPHHHKQRQDGEQDQLSPLTNNPNDARDASSDSSTLTNSNVSVTEKSAEKSNDSESTTANSFASGLLQNDTASSLDPSIASSPSPSISDLTATSIAIETEASKSKSMTTTPAPSDETTTFSSITLDIITPTKVAQPDSDLNAVRSETSSEKPASSPESSSTTITTTTTTTTTPETSPTTEAPAATILPVTTVAPLQTTEATTTPSTTTTPTPTTTIAPTTTTTTAAPTTTTPTTTTTTTTTTEDLVRSETTTTELPTTTPTTTTTTKTLVPITTTTPETSPSTETITTTTSTLAPTTTTTTTVSPSIETSSPEQPTNNDNRCNFLPTTDKDQLQKVFREETTYRNGTIKGRFTYVSYDRRYKLVHYTRQPYGPVKIDQVEELGKSGIDNQPDGPQVNGLNNMNEFQTRNNAPPNRFGGAPMIPPFGSPMFNNNPFSLPNGPPFIPLYFPSESIPTTTNNQPPSSYASGASQLERQQQQQSKSKPTTTPLREAYNEASNLVPTKSTQSSDRQGSPNDRPQNKVYYAPQYAPARSFQQPQYYSSDSAILNSNPNYPIYHMNLNQNLNQRQQQLEADAVASVAAQLAETSGLGIENSMMPGYSSGAQHEHAHYIAPFMLINHTPINNLGESRPKLLKVKTSKSLHSSKTSHHNSASSSSLVSPSTFGRKSAALTMQPQQQQQQQNSLVSPPTSTRQRHRSGKQSSSLNTRPINNQTPIVYHVLPRQSTLFHPDYFPSDLFQQQQPNANIHHLAVDLN